MGGLGVEGKCGHIDRGSLKERDGGGFRIELADGEELFMQERRVVNRAVEIGVANCVQRLLGDSGSFELDHKTGAFVDAGEDFFESGDGKFARDGADSADFAQGSGRDRSAAGGGCVERAVVEHDEMAVSGLLHVDLDYVDAEAQRLFDGKERVPRSMAGSAAMADAKARHAYIMADHRAPELREGVGA